jgi:hypothetical protein
MASDQDVDVLVVEGFSNGGWQRNFNMAARFIFVEWICSMV